MYDKVLEAAALSTSCGRCGAVPRTWCVTSSGRRASDLHADRREPVHAGWFAGFEAALKDAAEDPDGFARYAARHAERKANR